MINLVENWHFQINEPVLQIEIGDVNNNSQNEILAFSKLGKLLIFSLSGRKITELEISENSSIWQAKICDIDGDNKNELILGGIDGLLRTFKCNSSYELQPFWAHQFGASISGFLYSDVTGDSSEEILAYSIDKSLRCLNPHDGALIWGQIFEDGIGGAILWQDAINSSAKEVIACGNDGTIRNFKGKNGELNWFKQFNDKIRCVSSIKSKTKEMIICGGDDKKLHIIDKNTQEVFNSLQFDDFVWKCASFMFEGKPYLLVSTYSFIYFDDTIKIEDIEFSSKVLCLNPNFEKKWEIENINLECFLQVNIFSNDYFIIGTTKGKILILEAGTGKIVAEVNKASCVNDIKYDLESNILISCHDNGSIFAYFIGNS